MHNICLFSCHCHVSNICQLQVDGVTSWPHSNPVTKNWEAEYEGTVKNETVESGKCGTNQTGEKIC